MYHALRNETGTLGSPVKWDRDFRLSIHFFNTPAEIDDALDLLADRCRSRIGR